MVKHLEITDIEDEEVSGTGRLMFGKKKSRHGRRENLGVPERVWQMSPKELESSSMSAGAVLQSQCFARHARSSKDLRE